MSSRVIFLFCLPRSRSQWFVEMVKRQGVTAWHDPSKDCTHPKQLVDKINHWLDNNSGRLFIADTAALLFHRYLTTALPDMDDIYVMRRYIDTLESVRRQTGEDWGVLLWPMYSRLLAMRTLGTTMLDFENIREVDLALVLHLCGGTLDFKSKDLRAMLNEVVDTPICDQITYPEKTKQLLAYREIG
jgi:hypothetical protein